ncbi:minichromosome maintenance protein MCM [Methanococcus maripaludis]|uniref:Replicative DNA helicase Mcm n=2 Tax=Methanococcus maripaludis TaxID=39152 RepID=A0A7J9PGF1_METMI|nr:minichromosome maintenance protein MCM [Methanococcus maripaludis]MBA2861787.1 replicative DNA helicase Mcm [Methanococcus maripaludis]
MDDKKIHELRLYLVDYLKAYHLDDFRIEKYRVKVDIKNIYENYGFEFVNYLEEEPKEAVNLLEEAYTEAYYSVKGDKPHFVLSIYNLPDTINKKSGKVVTIEDINVETHGRLLEVEGIIVLATKIKMALKRGVHICTSCGEKKIEYIEKPFEAQFEPVCPKCAQNMMLLEDDSETKYVNFQELKLQQPLDLMSDPEEPPKFITVLLENSPGFYTGRVKVTGIPIKIQRNKKVPMYDLVFSGIHCEPVSEKLESDFTENEIESFEKIAKNENVIEILADRLIPDLKGYMTVKKAVFLQQVKGVKKGNKRNDSHILLITDPGTGKSLSLRKIAKIPGNVYGSVNMASGVGLTASVVQEKTEIGDNTYVIKPGLLVKANGGTACIDEFATNKKLHENLLEAMESQTIHISKGGLNTKLPSECAVLAAGNPRWGRFDPNVSIMEQINISPPILSRFDLIFPLIDEPDRTKDRGIAHHIISIHRAHLDKGKDKEIDLTSKVIDDIEIDFGFICKYITYARQLEPKITDEAENILTDYYLKMRKGVVQITARQLEAAIRLSEAIAKARLKTEVTCEDALEAVELINESLKETAFDPETGQYDVDKIMGVSKKERSRLTEVYDAIKDLGSIKDLVLYDDLLEALKMKEAILKEAIKKLITNGDIDEPKTGMYRII